MWPDRRITALLGIDLPILQAPMTGVHRSALAIAVSDAGGLGALPCSTLGPADIRADVAAIRSATDRPFNLNFTCHRMPAPDPARDAAWRRRLAGYHAEFNLPPGGAAGPLRAPFDDLQCALVEELRPPVVSFHFGLPEPPLLERVRSTGAVILSSATTVDEARWLADAGCHAILAQGLEAGGHRGMFRTDDLATQLGTAVLVPQIADAVAIPVIAAGGIADARGIAAAFHLGAAGVQLGTAYLLCPETTLPPAHRQALRAAAGPTAITNVFTGRPARGLVNRAVRELGPLSADAPAYPLASAALAPLRAAAEAAGRVDFTPLFAGQAIHHALDLPAGELTRRLAADALARLTRP